MTGPKPGICFSRWFGKLPVLVCCLYIITGCGQKRSSNESSRDTVLDRYITAHHIKAFNDSTSAILVLSEEGCMNCDKSFSGLLQSFVNNPHTLIIVTASGTRIDISPFQHDSIRNVFFDDRGEFSGLDLMESSGAIFLEQRQVDTIVPIEASNIQEQMRYISSRVK